ncbi:hypothetical protein BpHYR1_049034 [Brachionus plicatilis]|uniref:Uncharacterized protein n=1 Tax=Brachionus plicatilis TaxID=10195 RepID=A0A3M7S639_BRAPC|nr:hypothetical protein BpHYR1_049034 [Brachionus plicatilis]
MVKDLSVKYISDYNLKLFVAGFYGCWYFLVAGSCLLSVFSHYQSPATENPQLRFWLLVVGSW